MALQTAFIPIKASMPSPIPQAMPATIRIEVPHLNGVVVVSWRQNCTNALHVT